MLNENQRQYLRTGAEIVHKAAIDMRRLEELKRRPFHRLAPLEQRELIKLNRMRRLICVGR